MGPSSTRVPLLESRSSTVTVASWHTVSAACRRETSLQVSTIRACGSRPTRWHP